MCAFMHLNHSTLNMMLEHKMFCRKVVGEMKQIILCQYGFSIRLMVFEIIEQKCLPVPELLCCVYVSCFVVLKIELVR
jgi:hypothetical protein